MLTPFRIRQLTRRIAEGERIDREALIEQLVALGYQRTDTVAEHGEYAVRGSLIDLFPAGEELALRLDFFGDEIDSLRRFDPADQRSTDKAEAFTLMPASEALLDDESIKRFRSRYREKFGATATQDPLYQALSDGRRMAGMEHWLPLLEERLATLFDHLGEHDLIVRDSAADQALEARREAIDDYYQNRVRAMEAEPGSYRPLEPDALYLSQGGMGRRRGRPADPPRLALPRAGIRPDHRLRRRAGARFRARAGAAGECLRSGRQACRQLRRERPQGRARQLHARRARAAQPVCSRITA